MFQFVFPSCVFILEKVVTDLVKTKERQRYCVSDTTEKKYELEGKKNIQLLPCFLGTAVLHVNAWVTVFLYHFYLHYRMIES